MQVVFPGNDITFEAVYQSGSGLIDMDAVAVTISDPDANEVVSDAAATRISQGTYRYTFSAPSDAPVGLWTLDWAATLGSSPVNGSEPFEVLAAVVMVLDSSLQSNQARLRARLNERDENDSIFANEEITEILTLSGDDLDSATLEGWIRKMAHFQELIDYHESGVDRELSQKFRNAQKMVDFWQRTLAANAIAVASRGNRVVGRPINLDESDDEVLATPFSGYSDNIRMYPTHRFLIPAIISGG